jgi:hypothetical protein
MEGVAGDEELDALPAAQIRAENDPLAGAVVAQQEYFERIAEVVVIQLVIANAMEPHRCGWCHHEVERGSHGAPITEW